MTQDTAKLLALCDQIETESTNGIYYGGPHAYVTEVAHALKSRLTAEQAQGVEANIEKLLDRAERVLKREHDGRSARMQVHPSEIITILRENAELKTMMDAQGQGKGENWVADAYGGTTFPPTSEISCNSGPSPDQPVAENLRADSCPPRRRDDAGIGGELASLPPVGQRVAVSREQLILLIEETVVGQPGICGPCGGRFPNPDCGHKGHPDACIPALPNYDEVADAILALLSPTPAESQEKGR